MNCNRIILSSLLVLTGILAAAQEKEVTVFNPHWYVQAQAGVQETLGETTFGKLLAPNAQIGFGYNFSPKFGARFALNSWQSRAGIELNEGLSRWKWNYIAPVIDLTAELTNIIGGYKPDRLVSVGVFAGVGANIGFNNGEANDVKAGTDRLKYEVLRYCWDGAKARMLGRLGANVDFRVSNRVSLGIEFQANTLSDKYNSKKAGNSDWYFNALAGVKVSLGKKSRKVPAPVPVMLHDTVYVDRVVEKVVEKRVEVPVETKVEEVLSLRRDIFFSLAKYEIESQEVGKVEDVAEYLKANPDSKVIITGYADKGAGSKSFNLKLARDRSNAVFNLLVDKYQIPYHRIIVKSMGEDLEQPYDEVVKNRVVICVAE
ncbi:MAG: OmpA family protein [Candidatus Cryptobacteroides sp.]